MRDKIKTSLKTLVRQHKIAIYSGIWCATVLSIIIAANTGNLGWAYQLAQYIPLFDKLGHAVLFGGMSFLTGLALPSTKALKKFGVSVSWKLPLGSNLILLFSVLEELSQLFLTHRNFDLIDLLVNMVAIVLGGALAKHCTGHIA